MKTIKIKLFILFYFILLTNSLAQNRISGVLWVTIQEDEYKPQNGELSKDVGLRSLFNQFNVTEVVQIFPFAKTPLLLNAFEIKCNCDEVELSNSLKTQFGSFLTNVEYQYEGSLMYDPVDYFWQETINPNTGNPQWYLQIMEANKAWDITKGDPNLKVAVMDAGIDTLHHDIAGKVYPPFNFYTGLPFSYPANGNTSHGNSVVSLLAAETVDAGQISKGYMAGIGYNTRVMYSDAFSLPICLYASTVAKAKVISISWLTGCSPSIYALNVEQEILNNGTTIVRAAGNGSIHCNGGRVYPFSGFEDPRTIVVSSTWIDDKHFYTPGGTSHSHYPEVDVCAPGYQLTCAANTSGGTNKLAYYNPGGTSQSTPLVAGTVALMLSIKPCLPASDVEYILKQTSDPIVDESSYPGLVGSGRVNTFKAVQMAQNYGNTSDILTNTTWSSDKFIGNNFVVKAGNTLTISSKIHFSEGIKVIVEPGAKIVVDGGTLTSSCSWQGIELWGNSAVAQTISSGYSAQAHLILKNGAVIENARNAVTTWKFNDYAKTGGIITASDAIFRNNHRSVEFISYPFAEKSTFKNCKFIIDGPLNDGGYCTNMVTAWNVNGTSFQGCTFECTYTGLYGTAPLPKGIYTHNANFRVIPLCTAPPGAPFPCPPTQQQPNYFKGLFYGIHATNGTSFPYRVDSAHFENCAYGIYSDRVNNFQVTRSTFKINPFYVTGTATGMENNCGTGFKIEGNRFYTTHAQAQNYLLVGLMNVNTGPALNEVYRNKYENLRIANNSALTNWSWGGGNTDQGLKYKCNTHTGNLRDLMVVNGTVGQNQGEVVNGGNNTFNFFPAGNTFSVTSDPVGHIANFGQNLIRYVHHNPASTPLIVQPTNITLNNVTLQFSSLSYNSGSCPSKLGKQIADSKTEFYLAKSNYDDVRYVYDNLLNGGNTQSTLHQVENSWPAQAWELRNQLLAKSPFLGMEVLYEVADRTDVLPHALMLEVFMANPHCAKDRRFLAYLENKSVPMPGWMINLLAGNTARTLKDDLEAAMSQQASVWATAADEIIHHYLSDEAGYSPDSALAWVNRKTTYVAKLQKSDLSAANTAYGDALADIQLIRDSFVKLPDELSADLNSREDLYTLLAGFGQNYWGLDTAAQLTLLDFALSGKMTGHTEAANILRFFYGYAIDHTLFAEEPEPKSIKNSMPGNTHQDALLMKVYPNPGDEYVVFEYILPELPLLGNEFWAEIVDLEGRVLFSESLNGTRGVKTVDVSGYKAGAYLYRLSGKTGTLESGTLIIK